MSDSTRPYIICHMMSTIDGKITSGEATDILDNYFDLYTKTEDLLESHTAWMCGRVTMQMFATVDTKPLPTLSRDIKPIDYIAPHDEKLFMFGVDTKGLLRWDKNNIQLSNVALPLHLVIIVTKSTPKEYLQYLQERHISYLVAGEGRIDFDLLFTAIKEKFKVEKLLLEGGGLLNGSVMAAGLVDEISLLITPLVLAKSNAPSAFERKVVEALNVHTYSLFAVKQMEKDSVWLRYKK